jgi:hypothetical protein
MKVKDLIKKLEKENPELHVYIPRFDPDEPVYQLCKHVKEDELQDLNTDSGDLLCIILR